MKTLTNFEDSLVSATRMDDGKRGEHAHSRRLEVGVAPGKDGMYQAGAAHFSVRFL